MQQNGFIGGRVLYGYASSRATGNMRAREAATAALAALKPPAESVTPLALMVVFSGSEQTLLLREYDAAMEALHASIPDTANLLIDCVCNASLGEQFEVTLVAEYLQRLPTGGDHGIPVDQPST